MKELNVKQQKIIHGGFWNEVARGVGLLNPATRDYFKQKILRENR
ncbi:hypothetical protein [Staphylococcus auricularis]|nr:hypothetical protein [Staphylococcus auricularis]